MNEEEKLKREKYENEKVRIEEEIKIIKEGDLKRKQKEEE